MLGRWGFEMAKLKDILAYILKRYPRKHDLSNARVTKLVYLSDWRNAIKHGRQLSDIKWYFDNYGPFVHDVKSEVSANPDLFAETNSSTPYGNPKSLFSLRDESYEPLLSSE